MGSGGPAPALSRVWRSGSMASQDKQQEQQVLMEDCSDDEEAYYNNNNVYETNNNNNNCEDANNNNSSSSGGSGEHSSASAPFHKLAGTSDRPLNITVTAKVLFGSVSAISALKAERKKKPS